MKKSLFKKIIYNLAWWIIHRIDNEAKDVGDTIRWKNMIFYIRSFDCTMYLNGPARATLELEEYRLRDIINPMTYKRATPVLKTGGHEND